MVKFLETKIFKILLAISIVLMAIFRFLANENGRTSPDSIRYLRTAYKLPAVDNTIASHGYPFFLKLLSFSGIPLFWCSKVLGIFCVIFIIFFAWRKNFYKKEILLFSTLASSISLFAATLSEACIFPLLFLLFYFAGEVINGTNRKKYLLITSLILIALFLIKYSSVFIIGACGLFGLFNFKKIYGKQFFLAAVISTFFVVGYKFLFLDIFNENYTKENLEIGLKSAPKLMGELWRGLCTSFNPFIHIANPAGGKINVLIYAIGAVNIFAIIFLLIKFKPNLSEKFILYISLCGIAGSFFVQFFYSLDALDFRLLAPFTFGIWLLYFRRLFLIFGNLSYLVGFGALTSLFIFSWLSRGNYLENRRQITQFLNDENLKFAQLKFFVPDDKDLDKMQLTQLISTVNPNIKITRNARDTLQRTTLTQHKVLSKIKLRKNRFQ